MGSAFRENEAQHRSFFLRIQINRQIALHSAHSLHSAMLLSLRSATLHSARYIKFFEDV